jgi:hypothetical protein
MKTKKKFDINRVREFCKLVNEGNEPNDALRKMNTCVGYYTPLKQSGLFWKENGTYKAVERIHVERYNIFLNERLKYNRSMNSKPTSKQRKKFIQKVDIVSKRNSYKEYTKQASLFNQPKTNNAPTMKPKERQLTFIQRVVKSLFNL